MSRFQMMGVLASEFFRMSCVKNSGHENDWVMLTRSRLLAGAFPQRHSLYYLELRLFLGQAETILNILLYFSRFEQLSYKPRRSRVRFPMVQLQFCVDDPSCRTPSLGSTQSVTQMTTRDVSWGEG